MRRKKQFTTIVSVAVMSFLIGMMFNMNFFAVGGARPNKVWTAIYELQSRVSDLEAKSLGFLSEPAYDSGWAPLPRGYNYFAHNLNTTEIFVYVIGKNLPDPWNPDEKIHIIEYGGVVQGGANWWYDIQDPKNVLVVNRLSSDITWDEVRVMIWRIWEP